MVIQKIKSYLKSKYTSYKKEKQEQRAAEMIMKPKVVAAYRQSLEKERIRLARLKAKQDIRNRYKAMQPKRQMPIRQFRRPMPSRENATIPDTGGFIPMANIHKEIFDAANMVP